MEETILGRVPDDELLRRLGELVSQSRRVEADLVWHIAEVDERRLYAREAFPSMFAYCTGALHLSEAEAYLRITVARAARKHGALLEMLRDGRLHLRGIAMLAPLLTDENRESLLGRASHRSKREVEELVAELSPRPDAPPRIRKLPKGGHSATTDQAGMERSSRDELCPDRVGDTREQAASADPVSKATLAALPLTSSLRRDASPTAPRVAPSSGHDAPLARSAAEPLSPGRYKVQFTASAGLKDKIERLTALMRSEVPDGDLARIIEQAVSERLERLEARRFGKTRVSRKTVAESDTTPTSRRVPSAVRRTVHQRDAGRCAYVDSKGRRCAELGRLEFHHRHPFGMGGDHAAENVSLLCRAHNAYLAELDYGRSAIRQTRAEARPRPAAANAG